MCKEILSEYFENPNPMITATCSGELNKVTIFTQDEKEYVLRETIREKSEDDIQYEHEFTEQLSKHSKNIHIPKILRTSAGSLFVKTNNKTYTVMTKVPGKQRFKNWYDSHTYTPQDIEEGFKTLAILHNCYRKITIKDRKQSQTEQDILEAAKKTLSQLEKIPFGNIKNILEKNKEILSKKITTLLQELKSKTSQRFPTHYDMNYTNVLWKNKKIISIVDFDWAQHATLEFDFAQACKLVIGGFAITGASDKIKKEKFELALATYNKYSEVPFTDTQRIKGAIHISSVFLLSWAIDRFLSDLKREDYYTHFVKTAITRFKQEL